VSHKYFVFTAFGFDFLVGSVSEESLHCWLELVEIFEVVEQAIFDVYLWEQKDWVFDVDHVLLFGLLV
jgi:hypothetical protein